jgi:hypothetical protein
VQQGEGGTSFFSFFERFHEFAVEFTAGRWLCPVAGHLSSDRDESARIDLAATLQGTNFLPSRRPGKEQLELSDTP